MTREQIHEVLDVVLDCNGLEARQREKTGTKPTVFFFLSGHVGDISVSIHKNGWVTGSSPDSRVEFDMDRDCPQTKIEQLRAMAVTALDDDDTSGLEAENDALREKIAKLKEQIRKNNEILKGDKNEDC